MVFNQTVLDILNKPLTSTVDAGNRDPIQKSAGYDQQLVSDYDAMSPEERQVRGWTSQVRDSAASFVSATTASSTGSNSSLFDLLNNVDDSNSF